MKEIKVSVIIPVYNTPLGFFERCIISVEQQLYSFFEIVVIDDGSERELSDQYLQVCQKYDNIKYFYQKNRGVSSARNSGIQNSSGEYITFVDADDVILADFLVHGVELVKKYEKPDLVAGKIEFISEDGETSKNYKNTPICKTLKVCEDDIDKLKLLMSGIRQQNINFDITGSPCARLYKRSIASQIEFPDNITHWEDQIYNRLFLNLARSAVLTDEVWYHYYQNEFSAMHNSFNKMFIERSKPFWEIWNQLNATEKVEIRKEFEKKNVDFFYAAIHISIVDKNTEWLLKGTLIRELINEPIFRETTGNLKASDFDTLSDKLRFQLMKNRNYIMMYWLIKIKMYIYEREAR